MTYASGSTIAAADYNSLATTLNGTWNGAYGQTAVPTSLATGNTVTAAQWSTLIGALNNALAHQSGTAAITLPTAGSVVTYLAAVANGVNTAVSSKYSYASNGTIVGGSNFAATPSNANTTVAFGESTIATRTVTFASAAQASYFFAAGGKLSLVIGSVTGSGTAASNDLVTLLGTNLGGLGNFGYASSTGRTGSGGTLSSQNTSLGFSNVGTSPQVLTYVTSTTASYTSDFAKIYASVSGAVVTFYLNLAQGAHTFASSWALTVNHNVSIIPPETTHLSNTWGTITIA